MPAVSFTHPMHSLSECRTDAQASRAPGILESLRIQAQSRSSKKDIQLRQHFMERSFAHGTRFGLKRARWRGQWRVRIQDYLVAIVQNIQLLMAHARPKPTAALTLGVGGTFVVPTPLAWYCRQI